MAHTILENEEPRGTIMCTILQFDVKRLISGIVFSMRTDSRLFRALAIRTTPMPGETLLIQDEIGRRAGPQGASVARPEATAQEALASPAVPMVSSRNEREG
ncbi:MAG: hypothetical protein AB1646_01190 [Thermodesulfobacteriota bacterium]